MQRSAGADPTGEEGPKDPDSGTAALYGRSTELAQISVLIEDIGSVGGSLIVRGDPGIGKTALLTAAGQYATSLGQLMLRTTGVAAEQHLPYAALYRLLRPAMKAAGALAAQQREALNQVFGLSPAAPAPGTAPAPFTVALAALNLLVEWASDRRLLIIGDDAQWMDEASRDALFFLARRAEGEGMVVVVATREPAGPGSGEVMVAELPMNPLDDNASRQLLATAHPALTDHQSERTLQIALGNPLALLELPRDANGAGAVDGESLPAALERAFAGRLQRLSRPARSLLVAIAVQDGGVAADAWPVGEKICGTALAPDVLVEAERAGLVTLQGDDGPSDTRSSGLRFGRRPRRPSCGPRTWPGLTRFGPPTATATRGIAPGAHSAPTHRLPRNCAWRRSARSRADPLQPPNDGWNGQHRCPRTAPAGNACCSRPRRRRTKSGGRRRSSVC